MPKMPLEGIRVADFGWRVVAPVSARMLAWGGAEVIRVESSTRHDGARLSPPLSPGAGPAVSASRPLTTRICWRYGSSGFKIRENSKFAPYCAGVQLCMIAPCIM